MPDHKTFDSFYAGHNQLLVAAIKNSISQSDFRSLYFWSTASAGRTHLLYAACQQVSCEGKSAIYLPLDKVVTLPADMIEGMENIALICLDNIAAIKQSQQWQEALFDLFNRLKEQNKTTLLISGNVAANGLNLSLADLTSRLNWGQVYQLHPLNDEEKVLALQQRAGLKGFELSEDVAIYLMTHLTRDIKTLFNTLDQLDHASISAKRKLTIPFVKIVLSL